MATYAKEKGFTVQTLSTDPVGSRALGGSWASGPSLNTGRNQAMGLGTYTAAFAVGGDSPAGAPVRDEVESYNGTSWTNGTDINTGRRSGQGFGTTTAGVIAAGYDYSTPNPQFTETWNGSAWSESGDLTRAGGFQSQGVSATSSTAAVMYGGQPGTTYFKYSETWNGSSWSEGSDLNTGRVGPFGAGTATAGICMSGGPLPITAVETYNGSSWTTISATVNTPRNESGACNGTQTDCIIAGGYDGTSPGSVANTEIFDGTSFSEAGDLGTARYNLCRTYSPTMTAVNSLGVLGGPPSSQTIMEEWTAPTTFTKQIDGQLFFNSTANAFKVTEFNIPGATWASGSSLNTARYAGSGFGTSSDSGIVAGANPASNVVEQYNGSSWSEVAEINTARYISSSGFGSVTAGLIASGASPSAPPAATAVETWNGSSWTEVGEVNEGRTSYASSSSSPQTTGFIAGGSSEDKTETWNGTAWTEVGDLNTARDGIGGAGSSSTSGLAFGGTPNRDINESWDGSSWTEVGDLNTGREYLNGAGIQSNALAFAGRTSPPQTFKAQTESWNGSSWSEISDLSTARLQGMSGGISSSAFYAGGEAPGNSAATEEWTASLSNFTITSS